MAYISRVTDLNGSTYDIRARKTMAVPFGQVDISSEGSTITATVEGIDSLYDGICCYIYNADTTPSSDWTLNVNSLGAKPVYSAFDTEMEEQVTFTSGSTMMFIYNSHRGTNGCWDAYYKNQETAPEKVYELSYDENSSVGRAKVGSAVTAEPNYIPSVDIQQDMETVSFVTGVKAYYSSATGLNTSFSNGTLTFTGVTQSTEPVDLALTKVTKNIATSAPTFVGNGVKFVIKESDS